MRRFRKCNFGSPPVVDAYWMPKKNPVPPHGPSSMGHSAKKTEGFYFLAEPHLGDNLLLSAWPLCVSKTIIVILFPLQGMGLGIDR